MSRTSDDFKIPVLSASITQLMSIPREDPDYVEAVLQVVSQDPGLAAGAFRLANSAFFGGQEEAKTLAEAVMRVGGQRYVSLILGVHLVKAFVPSSPEMVALWRRALLVAAGNRYLATSIPQIGINKELAFVTGMLHEVGALILAAQAPAAYNELLMEVRVGSDDLLGMETSRLGTNHIEVGVMAAESWRLPSAAKEVIAHHHDRDLPSGLSAPKLVRLTQLSVRFEDLRQRGADDRSGKIPPNVSSAADRLGVTSEIEKLSTPVVLASILRESESDFETLGIPSEAA